MKKVIVLIVLGLIAWHFQKNFRHRTGAIATTSPVQPRPAIHALISQTPQHFTCDGRTHCSQMHSCEEAEYFLKHCPGTRMDGDHDGVPCERQLCQ